MTMPVEEMLRPNAQELGTDAYNAALNLAGQANNQALVAQLGAGARGLGVSEQGAGVSASTIQRSGNYLS